MSRVTRRWTARELLDLVLDEGSFESWDEPVDYSREPEAYRRELEAAAEKAGTDESVLTGRGLMHGRPVVVLVNEFRFLAGSIGRAAADRITSAVRRATAEGLPVLATTASGGTRMQEGTPAFVRMVEISRALMDHRAAGLPYLVYLRHPTTGGVFASWGSLAHVTVGEPGALIGFLGPKVYEALNGEPFPDDVQTAENLAAHGVIDAVVAAEDLPARGRAGAGRARRPAAAAAARAPSRCAGSGPARLGLGPAHPGRGARRRTRARAVRRRGDRPPRRHRPGRARRVDAAGAHPTRRAALRRGRPGPQQAVRHAARWARPRCARPGGRWRWPRSSGCRW